METEAKSGSQIGLDAHVVEGHLGLDVELGTDAVGDPGVASSPNPADVDVAVGTDLAAQEDLAVDTGVEAVLANTQGCFGLGLGPNTGMHGGVCVDILTGHAATRPNLELGAGTYADGCRDPVRPDRR